MAAVKVRQKAPLLHAEHAKQLLEHNALHREREHREPLEVRDVSMVAVMPALAPTRKWQTVQRNILDPKI